MTILENYSDKGELITKVNEPVVHRNLKQFIANYDPKIVQGYMMALADFNEEIRNIIWDEIYPRSAARTRTMMGKFHNEKKNLFEGFKLQGIDLPTPDQPRPMQD